MPSGFPELALLGRSSRDWDILSAARLSYSLEEDVDPIALRRRVSPVLPLSVYVDVTLIMGCPHPFGDC